MNFEVFSYGDGDLFRLVFTAIASIFGGSDYLAAISTAALLGFVCSLVVMAFDQKGQKGFQWFMAIIMFYMVAVVPKVDVVITDRIAPVNSAVVSNVPIGLAATSSFFSTAKDWLSRSFETVFSLPNRVQYGDGGLLFAQNVVVAASDFQITGQYLKPSLDEFMKSCVYIGGLGLGRFTADELLSTSDLSDFLGTRTSANTTFFNYVNAGGSTVLPCRSGWNDYLKPQVEAAIDDFVTRSASQYSPIMNKTGNVATAGSEMKATVTDALSYLSGMSLNGDSIAEQMALINTLGSSRISLAGELESTAQIEAFMLEKTELEKDLTNSAMAAISERVLPMLQGIFEITIYGIFPIVVLMALISPAKVSFAYVKALIWINLWAPMFALLHFFATYHDAQVMGAIAGTHGGALSAYANTAMLEQLGKTKATIGYVAASLPLIAYMLVSTSGAMMAGLAGRVLDGMDSAAQGAAREAADGDLKYMGERTTFAPNTTGLGSGLAANSSYETMSGQTVTSTGDGQTFVSNPQSSVQMDASTINGLSTNAEQSLSSAQEMRTQAQAGLVESTAATMQQLSSVESSAGISESSNLSFTGKDGSTVNLSSGVTNSLKEDVIQGSGISQRGAEVLRASAGFSAFDSLGASVTGEKSEISQEDWKRVEDYMTSQDYQSRLAVVSEGVQSIASASNAQVSDTQTEALRAATQEMTQANESYSQSASQVQSAQESLSRAERMEQRLSTANTDAMLRWHAGENGFADIRESAAMVAELANRGDYAALEEEFGGYFEPTASLNTQLFDDPRAAVSGTADSSRATAAQEGALASSAVVGAGSAAGIDRASIEGNVAADRADAQARFDNPVGGGMEGTPALNTEHAGRIIDKGEGLRGGGNALASDTAETITRLDKPTVQQFAEGLHESVTADAENSSDAERNYDDMVKAAEAKEAAYQAAGIK